jgi:hypothetical protein
MTYTLLQQMSTPSGAVSNSISATGLAEVVLDAETVPIATDTLMNIAFPFATIKAYVLLATCTCTVETNATDATGGQTISLTANVPRVWITGGDGSNLFSANVTKIYVTAAAAGTLTVRVLYDPTP